MAIIDQFYDLHGEMKAWRQHIHQHPELSLKEYQTSKYVQGLLAEMGIPYHTGYAGTGVIGVIKNGTSGRSIGLRADMDALAIYEQNDLPYVSQNKGVMHACGHDGHTAILLGTAKYLSETKNFDGIVYLYFQPAEEGLGGARIMLEDGAFKKFKPDAMYGLHNRPNVDIGKIGYATGAINANSDRFFVTIKGQGGHASSPHHTSDPVITAAHLLLALQSVVSRNVNPFSPVVISSCVVDVGMTENIIPETGKISGTVRTRDAATRDLVEKRMKEVCEGVAQTFNSTIDFVFKRCYPMCVNTPEETEYVRQIACDVVGETNVYESPANMGGEDFAFFLKEVPGSFFFLGNGDGTEVHTSTYNFNDDAMPYGATMFARLVESRLARS